MRTLYKQSLVVTYLNAGLGNQLFQYAAGRGLSAKLGCPLKVDLSSYAGSSERDFGLGRMGIKVIPVDKYERWRMQLSFGRRLHCVGKAGAVLGMQRFRVIDDLQNGAQPEVMQASGMVFIRGFWQSPKYFEHIGQQLREEMLDNEPPNADDTTLLKQMRDTNSVCVHVRRGDLVSNLRYAAEFVVQDEVYYASARDYLERRVSEPHYFVFSDDADWPQDRLDLGGRVTFLNRGKRRADWEDLRLMAGCRHFIIANSTFSWWGAWLAADAGKVVVAPRRWRIESDRPPVDLVPIEWATV